MTEPREVSNLNEFERMIADEKQAPVMPVKTKKVHVDHVGAANTLVKFIATTPNLNPLSKKIMIKKICNPGLTNLGLALELKCRERDIELFEAEGKYVCGAWLAKCTSQEAVDRVNADRAIQTELQNIKAQESLEGSKLA